MGSSGQFPRQPLLRTMLYKYMYLLVCQFGGSYGPETLGWLQV